jgi:hypothetical protein
MARTAAVTTPRTSPRGSTSSGEIRTVGPGAARASSSSSPANELKLVWPQAGIDPAELAGWRFDHFLIQPMDCADAREALDQSIAFVMANPGWELSLQTHKLLGLP